MKHEAWELKQMQAVPLEGKIAMTKTRIRQWRDYWQGDVYLSFSGGKDSTVLKHIIDSMDSSIPSVFSDTGLEYPEIRQFAMAQKNVVVVRPKISFVEVIKKYGYPVVSKEVAKCVYYARKNGANNAHYKKLFGTYLYKGEKSQYCCDNWKHLYHAPFKISSYCCDVMKKQPLHQYEKETKRKPIIATMAEESLNRKIAWLRTGCNAFESKKPRSQPMSFWTEQDVLHYIKKYDVPICSVYGSIQPKRKDGEQGQISMYELMGLYDDELLETSGCKRTGCIFCMFGCHLEKEPNRFQLLKQTHPKQYEYCMKGGHYENGQWVPDENGLGMGFILDWLKVKH